jgi:amino acid adenylation domain-containing protein
LLAVEEDCEALRILLEYSTATLSCQQADRIAGCVAEAVQCFFQDPHQKVRDVSLVDQQSQFDIAQWNNRDMDGAYHRCITEIIDEQSRSQPDAPAICSWDGELTYAQLESLSTKLAMHLKNLGIGANLMVPLCFEKSIWAIVAIMAVLKAGAAFVPLDASHPLVRLKQIIAQTSATIILVSERYTSLLKGTTDRILAVSESMMRQLPEVGRLLSPPAESHHVAYVLFTSGSTGSPKGCVVEHRALAAVVNHGKALQISSESRVLQFASYSFGVSLIEIFCPLTAGGSICIPSEHERINNPLGAIHRMAVNWAILTPSLVNSIDPENAPSLKTLAVAGEPLSKRIVDSWTGKVHLLPAYGLTEWAGICTVQPPFTPATNVKSIGTSPSANLWLVDPENHDVLAPIGAVAELVIEGPCLARGYLGDGERTAAAFFENPSWMQLYRPDRPSRLYRTGDLVRYGPEGTIHYVGRKGLQAKIRGQRIELGEVEYHACRSFRGATKVIAEVVVPAGEAQSSVLVAFVFCQDSGIRELEQGAEESDPGFILDRSDQAFRSNAAQANSTIRGLLPDYMVPQAYIPLRSVPLTVTGKVSRRTLRDAASALSYEDLTSYTETKPDIVFPASSTEKFLHQLVAQILNLQSDRFGVNESFFRLGGDSIKAMRLARQCRAEGVSITVQDIFREKTITGLSLCARNEGTDPSAQAGDGAEANFPLSTVQQSMIRAAGKSHDDSIQKLCLRLKSDIEPELIKTAIHETAKKHPMLRARFSQDSDSDWTQKVTLESQGAYLYDECTVSSEKDMSSLIRKRALDIRKGPVFAALYIRVDEGGQFLALLAHELVVDQTSWKIILTDVEEFLITGNLSGSPKAIHFREWCSSGLKRARARCITPHGRMAQECGRSGANSSPATRNHHAPATSFSVPHNTTGEIIGSASRLRIEPIEIFQAVLLHSFARTFEDRELPGIIVQEEGRGLSDHPKDFSQTVGQFATLLSVEVTSYGPPNLLDILCQTKECYRQSQNRQNVPPTNQPDLALLEEKPICVPSEKILFSFATPLQRWDNALLEQVYFQAREWPDYMLETMPPTLMAVYVCVINDCLTVSFSCGGKLEDADAQRWAQECKQSLNEAVNILRQGVPIFTPSDFQLLNLDAADLHNLLRSRLPEIGLNQTDVEAAYPCSPIQLGMLLAQAQQPACYQMFFIWEVAIVGDSLKVNLDKLHSAWLDLTQRHSILRTIFVESVGECSFIQVVLNVGASRTKVLRCADAEAYDSLYANRKTLEDGRESLPRFTICETDSGRVLCALDISHVLTDATSMAILKRDLALAYDNQLSISTGISYGDYIAFLESTSRKPALEYWRSYVAGCGPCIFPRLRGASVSSGDGAQLRQAHVPLVDTAKIFAFCDETGLTVSNVFQIAWGLVLRAFTGLDSVCFGYLSSGRDAAIPGIGDAVGPYINMLICRLDLDEPTTVMRMLRKVQADFTSGVAHQHFSLPDLFHSIDIAGKTLFNTCMTFVPEEVEGEVDKGRLAVKELKADLPDEVRRKHPRQRKLKKQEKKKKVRDNSGS